MRPFQRIFEEDPATDNFVADEVRGDIDEPDIDGAFAAFREAWRQGADLPELFGRQPLDLKTPVTPFGPHRRAELAKLETFLDRTGHLDLTPTEGPIGQPSIRLDDAIRDFQAERGLNVDGVVNPKGETHRELVTGLRPTVERPHTGSLITPGAGLAAHTDLGMRRAVFDPRETPPVTPGQLRDKDADPTRVPPAPRPPQSSTVRRSRPTHREAERQSMLALELNAIEKRLDRAEQRGQEFGLTLAARALRHFRKGGGKDIEVEHDWLRESSAFQTAERRVKKHFEDWLSLDRPPSKDAPEEEIRKDLVWLKDGEKFERSSRWVATVDFSMLQRMSGGRSSDLYWATGKSKIVSRGSFRFVRKGNRILIIGRVDHEWGDKFDWDKKKETTLPDGSTFKQEDAIKLQKFRGAKPFWLRSRWSSTMTATLKVKEDPETGKLTVVGIEDVKWRKNTPQVR